MSTLPNSYTPKLLKLHTPKLLYSQSPKPPSFQLEKVEFIICRIKKKMLSLGKNLPFITERDSKFE